MSNYRDQLKLSLFSIAMLLFFSQGAMAANECKVKYEYNAGSFYSPDNKVKTVYLNAGQTKTINQSDMHWVHNQSVHNVRAYLTNVNDITLGSGQRNPAAGIYVTGNSVKLDKLKCLVQASESVAQERPVSNSEKQVIQSVFGNTINFNSVRITNSLGAGGRMWVFQSPTGFKVNVGPNGYNSMTASNSKRVGLIHEFTHVWQGQHGVNYMANSGLHQGIGLITGNSAYSVQPGFNWVQYNIEQQAQIVAKWYNCGRRTDDNLYPYIQQNVLARKPFGRTNLRTRVRRMCN